MLLADDGLDTGWDAEEEGDDDDLRDGLEMRRIRLRLIDQREVPILPDGLRNIAEHNHDADGDDIDESHYTFHS